jgi:hypothetical protein
VLDRLTEHMEGGMDAESQDVTEQDRAAATVHVADVEADGEAGVEAHVDADGSRHDVETDEWTDGAPDDGITALLTALESADDLPLDERLQLLRDAEASIAGVLEGLDGL